MNALRRTEAKRFVRSFCRRAGRAILDLAMVGPVAGTVAPCGALILLVESLANRVLLAAQTQKRPVARAWGGEVGG